LVERFRATRPDLIKRLRQFAGGGVTGEARK